MTYDEVILLLCEDCHKKPATVHVTRIVNDQKTETHLCADCARKRGEVGIAPEPSFTFHNILAGLFDPETGTAPRGATQSGLVRCSNCGLSLHDFRRLGQLGCSHCYEQFHMELQPLLRRIHRSVEHTGKVPEGVGEPKLRLQREIDQLKEKLNEAVRQEAYEEAARLRDEIRELQKEL